jgi:hypothetical protein
MIKYTCLLLLFVLLFLGCSNQNRKQNSISKELFEHNNSILDSCIGKDNSLLLDEVVDIFEEFLVVNGFVADRTRMLQGYKKFFLRVLNEPLPDSTWKHNIDRYEALVEQFEKGDIMGYITTEQLADCIKKMHYPDTLYMHDYPTIMPQHGVSVQVGMSEFIDVVDAPEFTDPVLRKMVALEYFFGMAIMMVRPDELYLSQEDVDTFNKGL